MQLDGKVVLITGGGSGIGAAIAQSFVAEGATVAIAGRRIEALEATRDASGHDMRLYPVDVTDRPAVQAMVDDLIATYGKIDILVNNAGTNVKARLLPELSGEDWDKMIAVNTTGPFNVTSAVLPQMRKQHDGLVITISSISGIRPAALGGVGYNASKHAVAALSRSVWLEEHANGIRATTISPGEVDTPILVNRPNPVTEEHRARMLQPADVAAAALFAATLPPHACVPELVITPIWQAFA